jgi:uncharacterized protein YdaU (DUF1376 family)
MRINIFGLKDERWQEVDRVLYQIWCMNQSDTMLPKFLDKDFKRCFENLKRKYTLNEICDKLSI